MLFICLQFVGRLATSLDLFGTKPNRACLLGRDHSHGRVAIWVTKANRHEGRSSMANDRRLS